MSLRDSLIFSVDEREMLHSSELGLDKIPQADDTKRAVSLVNRAVWLWLVVIMIGGWLRA